MSNIPISNVQRQLETVCSKYTYFDPDDYWGTLPDTVLGLTGTILDNFLRDIHIVLRQCEQVSFHKVDFIGMSETRDAESVDAYFDIIWIENNHMFTLPIKLESA